MWQAGRVPDLKLLPQTTEDALQLAQWLSDPQAEWRQWDAPYLQAGNSQTGELDFLDEDLPHERLIWAGGAAVGLVTRRAEAPRQGGWWELGILIHDSRRWGAGLGTRALALWTTLTFQETGAHVLTLSTWSGNVRMLRAAERVGYRECARVREARLWQEQRYDNVQLGLLRREWEEAGRSWEQALFSPQTER